MGTPTLPDAQGPGIFLASLLTVVSYVREASTFLLERCKITPSPGSLL